MPKTRHPISTSGADAYADQIGEAVAEGHKEGLSEANERLKLVAYSTEYEGREAAAHILLSKSYLPADSIIGLLKTMPSGDQSALIAGALKIANGLVTASTSLQ